MKTVIFLALLLVVANCDYKLLKNVENFDENKFLGQWYGIAVIPYKLEAGCQCTQANYTLFNDSTIDFILGCKKNINDVSFTTQEGVLLTTNKNSEFKIKFDSMATEYDFWVLKVDENYTWAVIGEPTRVYLWIVARDPSLNQGIYQSLVDFAKSEQFSVDKLVITDQSCGSFL